MARRRLSENQFGLLFPRDRMENPKWSIGISVHGHSLLAHVMPLPFGGRTGLNFVPTALLYPCFSGPSFIRTLREGELTSFTSVVGEDGNQAYAYSTS